MKEFLRRVKTCAINLLDAEKAPDLEHPWMKYAGVFKDDPTFDERQTGSTSFSGSRVLIAIFCLQHRNWVNFGSAT